MKATAKFYAKNKASRDKKKAYDSKYHSTPSRIKYRSELNKANRKAKTYGNGDGKDISHTRKGGLVQEKASKNRARNGEKGRRLK